MKSAKSMMQGAVILSLATLLTKFLSAFYRVPFQNIVGNTGFYVYQQIYPIYGIGMTFALSGFPVFLSNLVAKYQRNAGLKKLLERSFFIMTMLGGVSCYILRRNANWIALCMGDIQLQPVIQSVSWMFLVMPFLVICRGYFQGTMRMTPTAVSQVVEQFVRVVGILVAASLYLRVSDDIYTIASWAMLSSTVAALAATLVLFGYVVYERHFQKGYCGVSHLSIEQAEIGWLRLLRQFILEGSVVCLLSSILVLYQLIDSFTIFKILTQQGISAEEAKNLKGIFDRGQPLVQLGLAVGIGFSVSYMPLLTRAFLKRKNVVFERLTQSLLKMTLIFSLAATTGMLVILPRLTVVLFGDRSDNLVLAIYVLSIFFASMIMVYHSILQSMGNYLTTLLALIIGLGIKGIGNQLLVWHFQTLGASLATVLGLFVMFVVMLLMDPSSLILRLPMMNLWKKVVTIIITVTVVVGCFQKGLQWIFPMGSSRKLDAIVTGFLVVLGMVSFIVEALRTNVFTIREWLIIPKGKEILRLANRMTK